MGNTTRQNQADLNNGLKVKLAGWEKRRDALVLELDQHFNADKWRELQIINHHIECTENRLNGDFNVKYDCDVYNLNELKQQ
jgi:hypothetical protein